MATIRHAGNIRDLLGQRAAFGASRRSWSLSACALGYSLPWCAPLSYWVRRRACDRGVDGSGDQFDRGMGLLREWLRARRLLMPVTIGLPFWLSGPRVFDLSVHGPFKRYP